MNIADIDYELPKELIAQEPSQKRDESRLLVVDRKTSELSDKRFRDIYDFMEPGDVLVVNDTKVIPAAIIGKKKNTGGKVELLLLNEYEVGSNVWRCLVQPTPKPERIVVFEGHEGVSAVFQGRDSAGIALMRFEGMNARELAKKIGIMPLPPYIKRPVNPEDTGAYQTVYAKNEGAVAAPTAGLHFTRELLEKLRMKGVECLQLTLHVGYGTFKPVEDLENHRMHAEEFELSEEVAGKINEAKSRGKKIWAVGTTALRVLETCVLDKKCIAGKGETDLFIREPFEFEIVDRLITNFHLPKTTLLLLVGAFMGESLRKKSYAHAIEQKYRFYSYGDAMVIL